MPDLPRLSCIPKAEVAWHDPCFMKKIMTTAKLSTASRVMSEGTMERLIGAAWRTFWVGLGASVVIVGARLAAPVPAPAAAEVAPAVEQHEVAPAKKSTFDAARISSAKIRGRHAS